MNIPLTKYRTKHKRRHLYPESNSYVINALAFFQVDR